MNYPISRLHHYKIVRQFSLGRSDCQIKNYYDSLGITPKATQGDIKSAYYKLSKVYHPDLNKNNDSAAEKFRDITAAYEVLGNVKSRRMYDRGILVTGSVGTENHPSTDEPVVENYKHAPFYHHRNKPTSNKTDTNKRMMYNMDEWTRGHYSNTFTAAWEKKQEFAKEMSDRKTSHEETNTGLQTVAIVIFLTLGALTFGTNSFISYDTPSRRPSSQPDEKPD